MIFSIKNLQFVHSFPSLIQSLRQLVSFAGQLRIHCKRSVSHLSIHIWLRLRTLNFTTLYHCLDPLYLIKSLSGTYGHSGGSNGSSWHVTTTNIGINLSKFIFWNLSLCGNSKHQCHLLNSHEPNLFSGQSMLNLFVQEWMKYPVINVLLFSNIIQWLNFFFNEIRVIKWTWIDI